VIGNDGWEQVAGDVWTIHDYALDGAALLERYGSLEALKRTFEQIQPQHHLLVLPGYEREGMAVLLTEFGGISYAPSDDAQWYGYGTVRDDAEYLAKYEELVDAILACPSIAGFCYTQLTDTEQEANGLLTALREPKLPVEAIRAINQRVSQAVPGEVIANIHAEAALKGKSSSTSGSGLGR